MREYDYVGDGLFSKFWFRGMEKKMETTTMGTGR